MNYIFPEDVKSEGCIVGYSHDPLSICTRISPSEACVVGLQIDNDGRGPQCHRRSLVARIIASCTDQRKQCMSYNISEALILSTYNVQHCALHLASLDSFSLFASCMSPYLPVGAERSFFCHTVAAFGFRSTLSISQIVP